MLQAGFIDVNSMAISGCQFLDYIINGSLDQSIYTHGRTHKHISDPNALSVGAVEYADSTSAER